MIGLNLPMMARKAYVPGSMASNPIKPGQPYGFLLLLTLGGADVGSPVGMLLALTQA